MYASYGRKILSVAPRPGGLSHRWRSGPGEGKWRKKSRVIDEEGSREPRGGGARKKKKDLPGFAEVDLMWDDQGNIWSYHLETGEVYKDEETRRMIEVWKRWNEITPAKERQRKRQKEVEKKREELRITLERGHTRRWRRRERYERARGLLRDNIERLIEKKQEQMKQKEQEQKKTEKTLETWMILERKRVVEGIEGFLEGYWEGKKQWCNEGGISTRERYVCWCPDIGWGFTIPCGRRREELTEWAEACYTERWCVWEARNAKDLERIDMRARLMMERRRVMMGVREWRGDKQELSEMIDESVVSENDMKLREKRKLGHEVRQRADGGGTQEKRQKGSGGEQQRKRDGRDASHQVSKKRSNKEDEDAKQRRMKGEKWWQFGVPGPPRRQR